MLLAGLVLLLAPSGGYGQVTAAGEYQIKAAFLPNFAKFVVWPSAALHTGSPLIIGVVGEDPFGVWLTRAVEGQSVEGHPLQVVHLRWNELPYNCHILFISSSEVNHVEQILSALEGFPVLTVADFDSFARRGGVIELKTEGNRVRFDINSTSASTAGLHVSSKLLTLAVRVYTSREAHR
jgi:hypothetical protein